MKSNNNSVIIFNARTIGTFFLLVFLAYGFGSSLFKSASNPEKYLGALLIVANSVMVLFIGFLLRKTLKLYNPLVGNIYLFTRLFEASALLTIFLNGSKPDDLGYVLAMLVLSSGRIGR
jgi:ABC-type glycerol-3-phosphate transport system permease component